MTQGRQRYHYEIHTSTVASVGSVKETAKVSKERLTTSIIK